MNNKPIKQGQEPIFCIDELREFEYGQWWVEELESMVKQGTDDQKRAVAVVRRFLKLIKLIPDTYPEEPIKQEPVWLLKAKELQESIDTTTSLLNVRGFAWKHDQLDLYKKTLDYLEELRAIQVVRSGKDREK